MFPRDEVVIHNIAEIFSSVMIRKSTKKNMSRFMENGLDFLSPDDPVIIIPIEDKEWDAKWQVFKSKANYSPSEKIIRVRESEYLRADAGHADGISIIMHEIGHYFLGHDHNLHHFSNTDDFIPQKEADPEWQADTFAAYVCNKMGIEFMQNEKQLRLF